MKKIIVLYICTDVDLAGSSRSLFYMIKSLEDKIDPIVLLSAKGEVYNYYTKENIKCIVQPFFYLDEQRKKIKTVLHHPSKSLYYKYWKIDKDCVNAIREKYNHVDIVHTNTSIVTVGVDLALALKAKHVWHIREYLDLDFNVNIFRGRLRLRRMINRADARIVITESVKKYWNFKECGTFVIWNAVRYANECSYVLSKEKYFLYSSTHLSENKGTSLAIRSFAKSNLQKSGYKLKILGHCSPEYKYELNQLIDECSLQNCVEFLGYQVDVKTFYLNAVAYLMTSKCEAMGRVTVEAMFYGCPIIARATGGTRDIIQNNYNGFLFNTEEECALLMNNVLYDKNVPTIIRNAICVARNHFSVEAYREKVLKIYNSVLV